MLITLLVFLLVIAVLVFVHELGHFLVAKWNGIKVEEFAFGFRPRLWSKTVGETTYAINLIPLGGYVKMYGEGDGQIGDRSFGSKTIFQRFLVMVAGAVMNLLLGWIILIVLFIVGFQPLFPGVAKNPFVSHTPSVLVATVAPDSPASRAGLTAGDRIISIDGQQPATDHEFISLVAQHLDQSVKLEVEKKSGRQTVELTPRSDPPQGQGAIGIGLEATGHVKTSLWAAPAAALYETGRIIGLSVQGFVDFVGRLVIRQEVSENVTGLVGVGVLTDVTRKLGVAYLAQLVMIISIGLGVVNLMPILPLDGGHIIALAYEKVRGRPLTERQLSTLVGIGLAIVLLLFVVVTYKDLIRFNVIGRLFS